MSHAARPSRPHAFSLFMLLAAPLKCELNPRLPPTDGLQSILSRITTGRARHSRTLSSSSGRNPPAHACLLPTPFREPLELPPRRHPTPHGRQVGGRREDHKQAVDLVQVLQSLVEDGAGRIACICVVEELVIPGRLQARLGRAPLEGCFASSRTWADFVRDLP